MTAFAAAEAVLHADRNLSIPATYRQAGRGAGVAVRIIRSAGGGLAQAFGRDLRVTQDASISVLASDCAPAKGDVWELADGTLLTATDVERSVEGGSYTVTVR